ncbi:insulinase family protein [Sphingomonas cannabina]|uniref:M16 family metallopeptidase n=1 Tax=Sphingomonas cannabina TaxID=2899123 RepID=UPI001F3E761A|nr:insulinase family protein [Sphingomonas cannabina]UIJ45883.1 insulinase family protein [Sphingomonas cannabina]
MIWFPRVLRPALVALPLLAAAIAAPAQEHAPLPAPQTQPGWLYKGSDIPPDPEWRFGVLPNGLRYAVRRNGVPPGQVAIRIRMDVGSLMEHDDELGYAHFIEHLSFRGSEHVADGEAMRIWQRMGATFGADTNASTSFTQTVYKIDLPSATEANLDESLKILEDMMDRPSLTQAVLDSERPVVLAEAREQPGPQMRLADLTRETFFAGQLLAKRSPIGKPETLTAATPAKMRAFQERWYRPERAVVVISGDIDPVTSERLIQRHFSSWQGEGPATPSPDFGKPAPGADPATASLVEPSLPPLLSMAYVRPWTIGDDTIIFNQKRMVDMIATRIVNRRLESRARGGGSFIQASTDLQDVSRSANITFVNILPLGNDWKAALGDVRQTIADAIAAPPTQAEIDREVGEIDANMRAQVASAKVEAGAKKADDMVEAVDIHETTTTMATSYAIFQDAVKKKFFTPAAVQASAKAVFSGTALRAVINSPTPGEDAAAELAAALKTDVKGAAEAAARLSKVSFDKLPKFGPKGKVVSRTVALADPKMERIEFANGVTMLLFENPSEVSRVYVRVRFGRGLTALPSDRPTPAFAADLALMPSGIGKMGQEEIDRLTGGRRIGYDFATDDDAFVVGATTSAEDLPDQLRLFAAKLQSPGWDPKPVARARAALLASYAALGASPDGVLARDLDGLLHAGDPRWGTPSREEIDQLTPESFRALWAPLLAEGPIEVQVFGDVKADTAIDAMARSFGALKPRKPAPAVAPAAKFPAHVANPVVRTHGGRDTQAAAVIAWPTGGGIEGVGEGRRLDVLAAVFRDRLLNQLRMKAGMSYTPNVDSQWPVGMPGGGRVMAMGMVPPDKTGFFFELARSIAADLAAKPVDADELKRALLPIAQQMMRFSTGNMFWLEQTEGGTLDPRRLKAVDTLASDLAGTTPQEIQALAAKYLRPDKDWTLVVLPEGSPQAAAAMAASKSAGGQ